MLAATPAARLTWYPGSIRPYASLWHTALRVAALNCLRSGELPDWPTALSATGQRQRSLYPLHNARVAVNTDALACALGEAPAVFRGSHFGALAPWLRFVVTPGFRLCVPCLEEGYHSALYSLRLLNTCPIHGTPLLARCRCGRPFKDRLSPADFARASSCACYQLLYFTPEACRCPTMPASLPRVLDPVIDWLEQLSRLIKPAPWREHARRGENPAWLSLLVECSESLGLAYPACFAKPVQATRRIFTVDASAPIPGVSKTAAVPAMEMPARSSYWTDSPATWTYRAMSRHLRRHVVRRQSGQGVMLFNALADLQHLADLLRTDRSALSALAEMLWTLRMEPQAHARRWPYRNPWRSGADPFHGRLAPASMVPSRDALPGAPCPLTPAGRHWIEYHAAGHVMVALWREALAQASRIASTGRSGWNLAAHDCSSRCDWSAQVQQDGSLRFRGLSADTVGLSERPSLDKSARSDAWHQTQQDRRQHLLAVCTGPCLSWTARDGWHVTAAARPAAQAWRRHRLLGVTGARPQFWLFEDGARFTARLCSVRLQAFGATPGSAIDALRKCVPQYIRLYGSSAQAYPSCFIEPSEAQSKAPCSIVGPDLLAK